MLEKIENLKNLIKSFDSMVVGLSGGVDSTLLCYFGYEVLHDKFLAITAQSETITEEEIVEAVDLARTYNWPHIIIQSDELKKIEFTINAADKCAICKGIRFTNIINYAQQHGFSVVASGDNLDDTRDYRPGLQRVKQLGVRSPLLEAGLNKQEIRAIAKNLGLANYNKPSNPCLATRIPYGVPITLEALKMIEQAEKVIKSLGYIYVRVRHHNNLARIEIERDKIINFVSFHADITTQSLKHIGYKYIALDLEGYRTGSLNEDIIDKNG